MIRSRISAAGYKLAVLRDINLEIGGSRLVVLGGSSGSGKTTLIHALTGVLTNLLGGWVSGYVVLGGSVDPLDPLGFLEVPRVVGVVLQDVEKQISMPTPLDEASFILENLGYREDEARRRALELLKRFGLGGKVGAHVEELSEGEKRRLAIASATIHNPRIVFFDEPTASLDPWGIAELRKFIREIIDLGSLVFVVEHKAKYFVDMADELYVMREGTIVKRYQARDLESKDVLDDLDRLGIDMSLRINRRALTSRSRRVIARAEDLLIGYREDNPLVEVESLDIAEGECIAVVGPNGSGKTALLKTLSGFLKPISGSFNVMGVDLHRSKISVRRGLVFYVSQHPDYMFFSRTVEGELKHIHRSSSINEILSKSTWIQRHLKSSPYRLSMGQKRWLSIAISMAYSPKILMLDEPTVGLDYSMYRDLISLLDSLRKRGLAIIIATHDPRLIADLCDRALLISGGTLVEKDPVELALELERIAGVSL